MTKIAIFYRGCTIHNHGIDAGFIIITPANKEIYVENAESVNQCKLWIDRMLAKLSIKKAFSVRSDRNEINTPTIEGSQRLD